MEAKSLYSLFGGMVSRAGINKCVAEGVGTFALVFVGTGAIVTNDLYGGLVTHVGISFAFGVTVMVVIYAIGDRSGAHINPAVTLAFWVAKRLPGREVPGYLAAQFCGAFLASALLRTLFSAHQTLGATVPAGSVWQSFMLEVVLSFLLMFVILCISTGAKEKGITAGAAIGGVVLVEAMFAGPVSGASMNPARSLAPALVSGDIGPVWIYLAAPCVGAILAVFACVCVQETGCCGPVVSADSAD